MATKVNSFKNFAPVTPQANAEDGDQGAGVKRETGATAHVREALLLKRLVSNDDKTILSQTIRDRFDSKIEHDRAWGDTSKIPTYGELRTSLGRALGPGQRNKIAAQEKLWLKMAAQHSWDFYAPVARDTKEGRIGFMLSAVAIFCDEDSDFPAHVMPLWYRRSLGFGLAYEALNPDGKASVRRAAAGKAAAEATATAVQIPAIPGNSKRRAYSPFVAWAKPKPSTERLSDVLAALGVNADIDALISRIRRLGATDKAEAATHAKAPAKLPAADRFLAALGETLGIAVEVPTDPLPQADALDEHGLIDPLSLISSASKAFSNNDSESSDDNEESIELIDIEDESI